MGARDVIGAGMIAVAIVAGTAANQAPVGPPEEAILQSFASSVEQHMALHRHLARGLPPLESSRDAENIQFAVEARAEAIRRARPDARVGDLFTREVATLFRGRIRESLAENGYTETAALLIVDKEMDLDGRPVLEVNGRFPWKFASRVLPCVLAWLPPLPAGLEYRFVHTDLVLVDVDATLIVDILPNALRELSYARVQPVHRGRPDELVYSPLPVRYGRRVVSELFIVCQPVQR